MRNSCLSGRVKDIHGPRKYAWAAAIFAASLFFANPAQAKVVYTKTDLVLSGDGQLNLDLNGDGRADFVISHDSGISKCKDGSTRSWTGVDVYSRNGAIAVDSNGYASALESGVVIDSSLTFLGYAAKMAFVNGCSPDHPAGNWVQVTDRFLGLQAKNHYGWIQASNTTSCGFFSCSSVTKVSGFAYETIPGKAIKAGQTQDDLEANLGLVRPDTDGCNVAGNELPIPSQADLQVEGMEPWRQEEHQSF